jgi:Tfp pilus assembly protein PilF
MLAEYYQQQGNRKAAIAQYEVATSLSGNPAALNNLAWLYYEVGDSRAAALAKRAHEMLPANPSLADTYGWILVESGKVAEGLPILEAAAKGTTADPELLYHYAVALAKSGQSQAAAATLRTLLATHKSFASRAKAEALLKTVS